MVNDDPTAGTPPGNPDQYDTGLIDLHLRVAPDHQLGAVKVEDATGQLTLLLAPGVALRLALRIGGACARLKAVGDGS